MPYQKIRPSFDKEELNKLRSEFDIVGYVEQTMDLKKNGDEYAAHCQRHKDDVCSCFINGAKNKWYCHSCHEGGDILDWLIKQEGLPYYKAVEKLQDLTGADLSPVYKPTSLTFFNELKATKEKMLDKPVITRAVIPESYLNHFVTEPDGPAEWREEGISAETMRRFHIMVDPKMNRIVYPVYDNDDNLIGVKGRTRFIAYKTLGIRKYVNYQKIGTTDYLQGMHENRQNIIEKDEIILLEGIKSVMKISDWGFTNGAAIETSALNDEQAKVIIQLGISSAVFAFDNDVEYANARKSAEKISRFMNAYIMYDKDGLLGDKSEKLSPCDKGEEIWRQLYNERRMIV